VANRLTSKSSMTSTGEEKRREATSERSRGAVCAWRGSGMGEGEREREREREREDEKKKEEERGRSKDICMHEDVAPKSIRLQINYRFPKL
jgi:hypothetical protein